MKYRSIAKQAALEASITAASAAAQQVQDGGKVDVLGTRYTNAQGRHLVQAWVGQLESTMRTLERQGVIASGTVLPPLLAPYAGSSTEKSSDD